MTAALAQVGNIVACPRCGAQQQVPLPGVKVVQSPQRAENQPENGDVMEAIVESDGARGRSPWNLFGAFSDMFDRRRKKQLLTQNRRALVISQAEAQAKLAQQLTRLGHVAHQEGRADEATGIDLAAFQQVQASKSRIEHSKKQLDLRIQQLEKRWRRLLEQHEQDGAPLHQSLAESGKQRCDAVAQVESVQAAMKQEVDRRKQWIRQLTDQCQKLVDLPCNGPNEAVEGLLRPASQSMSDTAKQLLSGLEQFDDWAGQLDSAGTEATRLQTQFDRCKAEVEKHRETADAMKAKAKSERDPLTESLESLNRDLTAIGQREARFLLAIGQAALAGQDPQLVRSDAFLRAAEAADQLKAIDASLASLDRELEQVS